MFAFYVLRYIRGAVTAQHIGPGTDVLVERVRTLCDVNVEH